MIIYLEMYRNTYTASDIGKNPGKGKIIDIRRYLRVADKERAEEAKEQ